MEVSQEEATHIIKGKRTKRQRPLSSLGGLTMTTSSSSGGGSCGDGGGGSLDYYNTIPSPTTSAEFAAESTEEEEDMANCLILLAQGQNKDGPRESGGGMERYSSRRFAETATTTIGKAGFYVYECKTCNKCFPSFQALGGHRASHKKSKTMVEEKKIVVSTEDETKFSNSSPILPLSLQIGNRGSSYGSNNKARVHECSICGSEFSSGQALGGHMRRHRTSTGSTTTTTTTTTTIPMTTITSEESQEAGKKPTRNILSLDLNLPAPEDDRDSKFSFASKQQPLIFSASSLVDCHY